MRKCVKHVFGVGHRRERGDDDRKQRTDGESCVMSLPPTCHHVFRFHYAAFQTLRRVLWLCIDPWRGESTRGCLFLMWHCEVLTAPAASTHDATACKFRACFAISWGPGRDTTIDTVQHTRISVKFCLYYVILLIVNSILTFRNRASYI